MGLAFGFQWFGVSVVKPTVHHGGLGKSFLKSLQIVASVSVQQMCLG